MRRALIALTAASTVFVASCADNNVQFEPLSVPPQAVLLDGARGGNAHFYLLPPLVKQPSYSGKFDTSLASSLSVVICDWNNACVGNASAYSVALEDDHYTFNWQTKGTTAGHVYRARILAANTELGFADVKVVGKGSELKDVDASRYVGVVQGGTLPIKFRVEVGAVVVVTPDHGGTVNTDDGATLTIPAGATSTPVGITVTPRPVTTLPTLPDSIRPPVGTTVYDFGPDGTTFNTPVTLTLPYDPSTLTTPASELRVYSYSPSTGKFETLFPTVDENAHTLTVQLSHFTVYWMGPPFMLYAALYSPAQPTVEVGASLPILVAVYDQYHNLLHPATTYSLNGVPTNTFRIDTPTSWEISYTARYGTQTMDGAFSGTAYQGVRALLISPANVDGVASVGNSTVTLKALDNVGNVVPDAVVSTIPAASTCGQLSSYKYPTATFTSPTVCDGYIALHVERNGIAKDTVISTHFAPVDLHMQVTDVTARPFESANFTVQVTPAMAGVQVFLSAGSNPPFGSLFTDANGVASGPITLTSGSPGNYTLTARTFGTATINSSSATGTLTLLPIRTALTVQSQPASVRRDGSTQFVGYLYAPNVPQPNSVLGKINYSVDGTNVGSGNAAVPFFYLPANLSIGTHTVTASFDGDANYDAAQASATFNVTAAASSITIAKVYDAVGTATTLTAQVTPAVAGRTVTFSVGGTSTGSATTDANGNASVSYTPSQGGVLTLQASVGANNEYLAASSSSTLVVSQPATLVANNSTTYISQPGTLNARINPIASGRTLHFTFDGSPLGDAVTGANGIANFNFTAPRLPGVHTWGVSFDGDSLYQASSAQGTVTLQSWASISLILSSYSIPVGGSTTIIASVADAMIGTPLNGKTIDFTINGQPVGTVTTDANGEARLTVTTSLGVGDYLVQGNVRADNTDNIYSLGTPSTPVTLTITKIPTSISAASVSVTYNTNVTLTATLSPAVAGATLSFVAGSHNLSAQTDANGVATASFTATEAAGSYPYSVSYAGDATHGLSQRSGLAYTVTRANVTMNVSNATGTVGTPLTLSATMTPFTVGKQVNWIFDGRGIGSSTVDATGTASITFSPQHAGTFTVFAAAPQDGFFNTATASATATIAQGTQTATLLASSQTFGQSGTLTASISPPRTGVTVVFFGKDGEAVGSATTGANGVASVNVALGYNAGSYQWFAQVQGDADYIGTSGIGNLTILRANTSLTASSATGAAGSVVTVSATLKPALAGQTIVFTAFNQQVSALTDANGLATASLTANAGGGTYSYNATYNATTNYNGSSTSAPITLSAQATTLSVANVTGNYPTVAVRALLTPAVPGAFVQFTLNGVSLGVAQVNASGFATLNFTPASVGNYTVAASYSGDSGHLPSNGSGVVTVLKGVTSISIPFLEAAPNSNFPLQATLSPAVAFKIVHWKITDQTTGAILASGDAQTDQGGTAHFNWQAPNVSQTTQYNLTVTYDGDSNYNGSAGTNVIFVGNGTDG